MDNEFKLINRIYPAIRSCVENRNKIVVGFFSVYAFLISSLNQKKEIVNQDVALFAAWVFTFFVVHNTLNYVFNAWEQYNLEETENNKIECCTRVWYLFRAFQPDVFRRHALKNAG